MGITVASLVISSAICYGLLYILTWHWRRRRLYKLASKFDGPPALPFIGNAHVLVGSGEYLLRNLDKESHDYSWPCRLWLGPSLLIFIKDPEHIKTVCLSPNTLGKGELMAHYCKLLFGTGLLTAPVSQWQVRRKLIQPTFNTKILDSFVEVFATQSKILTEQMERNLDGPEFAIVRFISSCTLDMICETTMGVTVKAQTDKNSNYPHALQKVAAGLCKRIFRIWLHPDFFFYLSQLGRDMRKNIKFSNDFTANVIRIKKNELLKRDSQPATAVNEDEDDSRKSTRGRQAFLDHLMALPDRSNILSDEALREEVDTMIAAGSGTDAVTSMNVMLMLVSHPDVQEKVYQELYEIYGDADIDEHPITAQDLPRMKYLERVIKETMRLFPPAPVLIRAVTNDLDIGDYTLPDGSTVVISIFSLHRSEKYWPDPLKFDPDRFLPEEVAKRHPYAFMAFSGGPRGCIGSKYAMMAMKTLIATVLRRFTLKKDKIVPVKDIRFQMAFLLTPAESIKLRIERRTGVMSRQRTSEGSTAKSK